MHQRQKKILEMLQRGRLFLKSAAAELGVTEMTLRRDLKYLEERKLAMRIKGGAIPHPVRYEPETPALRKTSDCKFAIAEALFDRIMPVDSIFLSTGSTTLAFAKVLARRNMIPMTVITNSLPVASALFGTICKVILLGGELRTNSLDLVGPIAEKNLAEYHVDYLISGCDAAFPDYGFYTSDVSLSNLEQRSLRIAAHATIITESSKFRQRALTRFAALDVIDMIITDSGIADTDAEAFTRAGIEVITVPGNCSDPE